MTFTSATAGPQGRVIYFSGSPTVTKYAAGSRSWRTNNPGLLVLGGQRQQLASMIEHRLKYVPGLITQEPMDTGTLNQARRPAGSLLINGRSSVHAGSGDEVGHWGGTRSGTIKGKSEVVSAAPLALRHTHRRRPGQATGRTLGAANYTHNPHNLLSTKASRPHAL